MTNLHLFKPPFETEESRTETDPIWVDPDQLVLAGIAQQVTSSDFDLPGHIILGYN